MPTSRAISADFPFESRFITVQGEKLHYIEEGEGDPVLFLHGNPTSCYLWRNIIPHVSKHARCIAPDLIGMGRSAKPALSYRFLDHYRFVEGFIEAMALRNLTLVVHDWGSALGIHYAMAHQDNVKGIAMMEAILRPIRWSDFPPSFKLGFRVMRTPGLGWAMICVMNVFLHKIMPQATVRALTPAEMDHYRAPFPTVGSRKPIRQWPLEIPIDGDPARMHTLISDNLDQLKASPLPKLLFYAHPGGIVGEELLAWCKAHLPELTTVDIGPGLHYVQEDNPHGIGEELARWYQGLSAGT